MKTLTLLALALATPAAADDFTFFQSPTGNIGCMAIVGDISEVRCDLRELTPSFTRRLRSGLGRQLCHRGQ